MIAFVHRTAPLALVMCLWRTAACTSAEPVHHAAEDSSTVTPSDATAASPASSPADSQVDSQSAPPSDDTVDALDAPAETVADPDTHAGLDGHATPSVGLTAARGPSGLVAELRLDAGAYALTFTTLGTAAEGAYSATFVGSDGRVAEVHVSGADTAVLTIDGFTLDGRGALDAAERSALDSLAASDFGLALAVAPLALGCSGDQGLAPAEAEAVLFPWQMLLKYAASAPSVPRVAALVACPYWVPRPGDPDAPSGTDEFPPASLPPLDEVEVPAASSTFVPPPRFRIEDAADIPYVPALWPFDAEGAATRDTFAGAPSIAVPGPCGALCRGACGADCDVDACTTSYYGYCVRDPSGNLTGERQALKRQRCGTHAGCRVHDQCYDDCNDAHGCGTFAAASCRRGCDTDCLLEYCPACAPLPPSCIPATCNCTSWMSGGGPFEPTRLVFDTVLYTVTDLDLCRPRCGDGTCQAGETCATCAADCRPDPAVVDCLDPAACTLSCCATCPTCGDNRCDSNEDCTNCAVDCSPTGMPVDCSDETECSLACCATCTRCGNGTCEPGETCASCVADCSATCPRCNDGFCDVGETCLSCPGDCSPSGQPVDCHDARSCTLACCASCPRCGDDVCDFGEDGLDCPDDCGAICGNRVCEWPAGEMVFDCAADCAPPGCGDGVCDVDAAENPETCPLDCFEGCTASELPDCLGGCSPANLIGNGTCDAAFDCPAWNFEGGECR